MPLSLPDPAEGSRRWALGEPPNLDQLTLSEPSAAFTDHGAQIAYSCSAGYVRKEGVNPGPVQAAQHLLDLAGPLTPQAMARIEQA